MNNKRFALRMRKELEVFILDPPHGISCYPKPENPLIVEAAIIGPTDTPYEGGIFHLEVQLPDEYPFYPPRVRCLTKIFHPNIDEQGRICLDLLKTPPAGSWRCTNSISHVLIAIQCLMSSPNPSDPLCPDIVIMPVHISQTSDALGEGGCSIPLLALTSFDVQADMYFNNRETYEKMARDYTAQYAQSETPPSSTSEIVPFDASEIKTHEDKHNNDGPVTSSTASLWTMPGASGSSGPCGSSMITESKANGGVAHDDSQDNSEPKPDSSSDVQKETSEKTPDFLDGVSSSEDPPAPKEESDESSSDDESPPFKKQRSS